MVRFITAFSVVALVAACGSGGSRYSSSNANKARYSSVPTQQVLFAAGPIANACRAAGRKQASRARCGCVQAVADRSLSSTEQRRGVAFFKDPHQAQVTRQSDNPANERFWKKWRAYGTQAAKLCT
ncbi:hypothetical protein [Pseudosulfitobacter sp. SM2401]|uniref:hypothetical protein n=1 Tax=Pseudosulfitobacter sp. SM2401 TaxID=3350098 RepID=UPI0036F20F76